MGLGTGATAAIIGGIGAAGSIGSAAIGANAAGNAASQEVNADKSAEQTIQSTEAPYVQGGQQSLQQLLAGLQSGEFGTPSTFTAPTLQQAEQTPGYQFTQQQGDQGVLEGAAAAGGNISGGTLRSLDQYNSGLASTTYGNVFNQALNAYGANLQGNQQAYQQLLAPTQLGANAANTSSQSIAQLLQSQGQSQAAGTVGTANAISSGLTSGTNSITQGLLLSQLLGSGGITPSGSASTSSALGLTSPASVYTPPTFPTTTTPTTAPLPTNISDYAALQGIGPG